MAEQPEASAAPGALETRSAPGLLANLVLVVVSTVLALALVEGLLVIIGYEHSPLAIVAGPGNDAREYNVFEESHFIYDPDLIWRPKRSFSVFNSQGFRGPELATPKDPGSLRIFAVGDSNTLGWRDAEGANWPAYLGERLGDAAPAAVVVNAGVWGYSSYQGLIRLREVLVFEPDIVLISFGANDAHPVSVPDREFVETSVGGLRLMRALQSSRIGQLLIAIFDRRGNDGDELTARVSLEEYRRNLAGMIAACAEQGVEVVLLTRPYMGSLNDEVQWKTHAPAYNAATVQVARREGVAAIDLYSLFKGKDELFADESHFTEEGHRLAARIVFEDLRPLLRR
jgi:lysophospholipase L1-like esterase